MNPVASRVAKPTAMVRATRVWFVVGSVLTAIHSLTAGGLSDAALMLLMLGAIGLLPWAILRNRPTPSWPWWAMLASGFLFVCAGTVRVAVDSTGNLTETRSLWPEAFALPGYAIFSAGLLALVRVRVRQQNRAEERLDSIMIAVGCMILAWIFVLAPLASDIDAPGKVKFALGVYLPLSAFNAAIAARLAFAPGKRSKAYLFLMTGLLAIMMGELLYYVVETDAVSLPGKLVNLPFATSYVFFAAAALHPSVRLVATPPPRTDFVAMSRARLALIAFVLLLPALMLAVWRPAHTGEAIVGITLVGALVAVAISRLVKALRDQAVISATLSYQATHDTLTELPNRQLVLTHLASLLSAASSSSARVGVLFVDVDQFKHINDSLGHAAGDRTLQAAGQRLRQSVRADDLVGRLSGDEFVIVADGVDATACSILAERIRESFVDPIDVGFPAHVSVSIGIAISAPGVKADDLLRDADTAMYRAKDHGRDSVVVFNSRMREELDRRISLELDLRKALAAGRLEVYYQPLVDLASGLVVGFEALCRWRRDDEWVPPLEVIQVAEESGLIVELGDYVLREACRQAARWSEQYGPKSIAVNVSAGQLQTTDFAASVQAALNDAGLPSRALCLEITESIMMHDTTDTLRLLQSLKQLGVELCVDDFGTGFSSLSYLQRFPVDQFKIDRSFTSALVDGRSKPLVRSMLAIGRELGLSVVAEGIETVAELEELKRLGCTLGQGYLMARPMAACDIPPLLSAPLIAGVRI